MFRLVADITELNIDQVKLPKIPGLGMLMKLPNKQKISMIVSVLLEALHTQCRMTIFNSVISATSQNILPPHLVIFYAIMLSLFS